MPDLRRVEVRKAPADAGLGVRRDVEVGEDVRVGIIGAGFAGLSAAKVLTGFGHQVTVYEKAPDVGGVWSRTRRYPGLSTQNNKGSYAFSDFPMPRGYPEWPSGEQVQRYLADYVRHFGLEPYLRLNTEVIEAGLDRMAGPWTVRSRKSGSDQEQVEEFDFIVAANGIFSDPVLPEYPGIEEFRAFGGRVSHTSQFLATTEARGKHVVIVGYGKSACDLAVALSGSAAGTTVVARHLLWKMPKRLGNLLNYKYLLLTRLGEALFPYLDSRGVEAFLNGRGRAVRDGMIGGLRAQVIRQLSLERSGLVPSGGFTDIARSTVSLVSDGFYERVLAGQIVVHREAEIERLVVRNGRSWCRLRSGDEIPADIVICGTGFQQRVPFLSEAMQRELLDDRGNFQLYRQILPLTVPKLAFSGYNSSFFSPLSAEMAALWIAKYLTGAIRLPSIDERRARVERRLRWMEQRTEGKHARGTNIIPFSMHNIDEMLLDLGIDVSPATKLKQWLLPVDPSAYRTVAGQLRARLLVPKPRTVAASAPGPVARPTEHQTH
jgi:dimethylaniline monooxygenase (N-oxide forming)